MGYKRLLVARIYDINNSLVGCGIYNSKTKRTECKALKDVVESLRKREIANMIINSQGRIEGTALGEKEFSCITSIRVVSAQSTEVIEPRVFIIEAVNNKQYRVIKPDGGPSVMDKADIIKAIKQGLAMAANFEVGEDGSFRMYGAKVQEETGEYSLKRLIELALETINREVNCHRINGNILKLNNGYNITLDRSRKCEGIQVEIQNCSTIKENATAKEFSFINEGWDGTGYIDRNLSPKAHDDELNKCKNVFSKFNLSIAQIKNSYEKTSLSIEDKNKLSANHYIKFDIPLENKSGYSLKDTNYVASIMLTILGRR